MIYNKIVLLILLILLLIIKFIILLMYLLLQQEINKQILIQHKVNQGFMKIDV